jgi:hypothetical protein
VSVNPGTTLLICVADGVLWAMIAIGLATSGSDPATSGLDTAAVAGVTVLFAITAFPAFVLTRFGRYPYAARALALAFPAAFVLMLGLVIASFA